MLKIAIAQLAPAWLNREAGLRKVADAIETAASQNAGLIVFGEAFVPGYPFWLAATDGAAWDSPRQKQIFAHYSDQAVVVQRGDLDEVTQLLKQKQMAAYLGIIERPADRSGHSLYCSYVYIDATGTIQSVHRKLQPTYDERLVWSPGDGNGLRVHQLNGFTVGALNCWENWMPLPRAALYALGEDLHIACWPGSRRNTEDLTPVLAKEGRSYCVSVSSLMRIEDILPDTPFAEEIAAGLKSLGNDMPADGGSCVAAPDGAWVLPPSTGVEEIRYCEIDPELVRRERQNFDPAGHYSRPDVTQLTVNRARQSTAKFID